MISSTDVLNANILIVDDLAVNVRLLEQILRGAGYTRISSTRDAREVCELHRQNHYDLILLDLRMPGMDGFTVMEGLKAIDTDSYVPVIVITAQPSQKLRALEAGAKDFINKPFEIAEVLVRIRNMLQVRLIHESARQDVKRMQTLALRDPLTGLANRRLLEDRLCIAMAHARRIKSRMALICLDVDGFKKINDLLGHSGGDQLLKLVAERLLATVREEDTVARQGGDEFTIVLSQVVNADAAGRVVAKLIHAVAQPFVVEGQTIKISISAGISLYSQYAEAAEALMKRADEALYEAKHAGKNTYRISQDACLAQPGSALPLEPGLIRHKEPLLKTQKDIRIRAL